MHLSGLFSLTHIGAKIAGFCVTAGIVIALLIAGGVFTQREAARTTVNAGRAVGFGTSLAGVGLVSWAQGIGDGFRFADLANKTPAKKTAAKKAPTTKPAT